MRETNILGANFCGAGAARAVGLMLLSALGLMFSGASTGLATDAPAKKNPSEAKSTEAAMLPNRPKVPGTMKMHMRVQKETKPGSKQFQQKYEVAEWKASETAIIICDMWDNHYCQSAAQRVGEMVPRMNKVINDARNRGVMIIHSPSGVINFYEKSPQVLRMKQAKYAKPPIPLKSWCYLDPKVEPEIPVDVSKQPCDDPIVGPAVRVFHRQHAGLTIGGYDGMSDNGQEMYNFLVQEGIKNVVLMGVHTNMCVLGRPFGIRQMKYLKFNVVLARDLTDAMYDPREKPFVSHHRGTQLVIEHIEKYWCPSILSNDLTRVIAGSDDPPRAGK